MAAPQSQAETAKALGMAQQEMEYRVDLFNRWTGVLRVPCAFCARFCGNPG